MSVVVVDYGIGNVASVCAALAHVGTKPVLSGDPDRIAGAERLVLPGVGAFGDCMRELTSRGLAEPVLAQLASDRPFLGICVGMQMLFEASDEFGEHAGLGIFPGRVRAIPDRTPTGAPLRVPHVGWSALRDTRGPFRFDTSVYFVHSFAAEPRDPQRVLARVDHGGHSLVAAVGDGSRLGVQFHPEKSGPVGLAILAAFAYR